MSMLGNVKFRCLGVLMLGILGAIRTVVHVLCLHVLYYFGFAILQTLLSHVSAYTF